jgi:nitroreductase
MFLDLIRRRRSIRRYQSRAVEAEMIDRLVEAALRAPSSRGLNPWQFVVVTDPELLGRLSRAKPHGAAFVRDAGLAIVVCADPARCDVWIEDASIAAIFIHLEATSLGLGSCWVQLRGRMHDETRSAEDYVAEVLGLPQGLQVECLVAVGYPAEEKPPHPAGAPLQEKVSFNRYGVRSGQ